MRSRTRLLLGQAAPLSDRSVLAPARIVDVRTEPPIVVRSAGRRVLFGASAAGPLGGDRIEVDVEVEAGVCADLGTVGATMILPNRPAAPSATVTVVDVGVGAHLSWRPEPMISVAESTHDATLLVRLADDATCVLVEEFALGRTGERSGDLRCTLRVERAGVPLVHHVEHYGPGVPGAGSLAAGPSGGHVISAVIVGDALGPGLAETMVVDDGCWAGAFPMADDATLITVLAPDRPTALACFERPATDAMV